MRKLIKGNGDSPQVTEFIGGKVIQGIESRFLKSKASGPSTTPTLSPPCPPPHWDFLEHALSFTSSLETRSLSSLKKDIEYLVDGEKIIYNYLRNHTDYLQWFWPNQKNADFDFSYQGYCILLTLTLGRKQLSNRSAVHTISLGSWGWWEAGDEWIGRDALSGKKEGEQIKPCKHVNYRLSSK